MLLDGMEYFARSTAWLASLACAAGYKRLALAYLEELMLAVNDGGRGVVVMSVRLFSSPSSACR